MHKQSIGSAFAMTPIPGGKTIGTFIIIFICSIVPARNPN